MEGEGRDERRLLHGGLRLGQLLVHDDELVKVLLELRVVGVDDLGEDGRGGLVGLVDDVHVELGGVQADGLVELGAGVVVEVHGHVHGQAEEPGPQLGLKVVDELRPGLEARGEEVTVAVLVLAPVLEVLEDGVELVVGVGLEVAVDGDVPPVANLLGQVSCVDDELGLEEGVLQIRGGERPGQSGARTRIPTKGYGRSRVDFVSPASYLSDDRVCPRSHRENESRQRRVSAGE